MISMYDYKWLAVCVLSHGRRVANVVQIIGADGQVKNNVDDDDDGDDGDHDDDDDNNDGESQILIKTLDVTDRSLMMIIHLIINLMLIMMILTIRVWIANLSSTCSPMPPNVQSST